MQQYLKLWQEEDVPEALNLVGMVGKRLRRVAGLLSGNREDLREEEQEVKHLFQAVSEAVGISDGIDDNGVARLVGSAAERQAAAFTRSFASRVRLRPSRFKRVNGEASEGDEIMSPSFQPASTALKVEFELSGNRYDLREEEQEVKHLFQAVSEAVGISDGIDDNGVARLVGSAAERQAAAFTRSFASRVRLRPSRFKRVHGEASEGDDIMSPSFQPASIALRVELERADEGANGDDTTGVGNHLVVRSSAPTLQYLTSDLVFYNGEQTTFANSEAQADDDKAPSKGCQEKSHFAGSDMRIHSSSQSPDKAKVPSIQHDAGPGYLHGEAEEKVQMLEMQKEVSGPCRRPAHLPGYREPTPQPAHSNRVRRLTAVFEAAQSSLRAQNKEEASQMIDEALSESSSSTPWLAHEALQEGLGAWVDGVDEDRMHELTKPKYTW